MGGFVYQTCKNWGFGKCARSKMRVRPEFLPVKRFFQCSENNYELASTGHVEGGETVVVIVADFGVADAVGSVDNVVDIVGEGEDF